MDPSSAAASPALGQRYTEERTDPIGHGGRRDAEDRLARGREPRTATVKKRGQQADDTKSQRAGHHAGRDGRRAFEPEEGEDGHDRPDREERKRGGGGAPGVAAELRRI